MKHITNYYQMFIRFLEPRSSREKLLMLVSGLVVLYLFFDALFFSPLYHRIQVTEGFIYEKQEILKALSQDDKIAEKVSKEKEIKKLEAALEKSSLVFPKDSLASLKSLLINDPSVRILSLNNEMQDEQKISKEPPYHLVLKGGYFDLQSFLKKLETIGTLDFLSMRYQVDEYPHGVMILDFKIMTPETQAQGS